MRAGLFRFPTTRPRPVGAYGASLTARDCYKNNGSASSSCWEFTNIEAAVDYQKLLIQCGGCENQCTVTKLIFQNQNVFYTGNRCERIYTNKGEKKRSGISLPEFKYQLLFDRENNPKGVPLLTIGVPRVLNMFENFPFWNTLFVECGLKVHLSNPSSNDLYEKGAGTVMSENICFPAKLVHGHIFDLIEANVDRIFLPMVFYEDKEFFENIDEILSVKGLDMINFGPTDLAMSFGLSLLYQMDAPPIKEAFEKRC